MSQPKASSTTRGLSSAIRRQIESFVRPLYVELDGVDTFDTVARRAAVVADLLGASPPEEPVDREYLDLLLLFHGTVKRSGSTDPGSRWWLFLRGQGLSDERIRQLAHGLGRWRESPRGPEEEALHDAELLEEVGIAACAHRIWRAGRKRVTLDRVVSTLDAGPAPERFCTPAARSLAADRSAAAESWVGTLRRAMAEA